jgi:hypothetical protein
MIAEVSIVGLMLASTHLGPMNVGAERTLLTPGAYVVMRNGITVGAYRNTLKRTSILAGYTHQLDGRVSLSAGVITGYPQTKTGYAHEPSRIGPYIAISYAFGQDSGARAMFMPQRTMPVAIAYELR